MLTICIKNHRILTILIKKVSYISYKPLNIHITPFDTKNYFKRKNMYKKPSHTNNSCEKPSHTNNSYEKPLYKQFL